jgi:hypothetical protein
MNLRYFLLLSLAYGMMSNLDVGTEHLRCVQQQEHKIADRNFFVGCEQGQEQEAARSTTFGTPLSALLKTIYSESWD